MASDGLPLADGFLRRAQPLQQNGCTGSSLAAGESILMVPYLCPLLPLSLLGFPVLQGCWHLPVTTAEDSKVE